MNWLNIHTDVLRSEEYLGADPIERATWLSLLGWCATQENGGCITGATNWKDRKWQQVCGITKAEVDLESELYEFIKQDLHVHHYPNEAEKAVVAKRLAGKKGGRPPKKPKKQESKPHGYVMDNHDEQLTLSEVETKGKERKGKGKVREKKKGVHIELPYDSENFTDAWNEWISYLKQKRKSPTNITIKKQLKQLSETNEKEAIEAIEQSIKNGWQGLFPKATEGLGKRANKKFGTNDSRSARNDTRAGEGIDVPLL